MDVKMNQGLSKRGQTTIFIIIAILIVASVLIYLTLKKDVEISDIPVSILPVYTSFLSCLEEDTLVGISVLESQAGYIEVPAFDPGSRYMPFSNQLDFLGNPVPYWYYVSGNNIQKEQVPSKRDMEEQLGEFVIEKISRCNLESYYEQGFDITINLEDSDANVLIQDSEVRVELNLDLSVSKEEDSSLIKSHNIVVSSSLGRLYDNAKRVYDQEQRDLFLENYGVDILRSYAPVDGVDITCSPSIWNAEEVFDDLEEAIEENTLALKARGAPDDYFVVDLPIDSDVGVRFLNSKEWSNGFEVNPSDGPIMSAQPVGNQPGLGVMGFCYVPYHFIYNVRYPVLVQVYDNRVDSGLGEIFQFPLAVVLEGNNPREALVGNGASELILPEICENKNTQIEVNTYSLDSRPVDAEIYYECFGVKCNIGESSSGTLVEEFPQCVNGNLVVMAEGFRDSKTLFDSVNPGSVDIYLERLYDMEVELKLDNRVYDEQAIITFSSDDFSRTIVYPEQTNVELSGGQYEVRVSIYRDSSLKLDSTTTRQCMQVPRSGVLGIVGLTKEKCFEIVIPDQEIESALSGGGVQNYFILEEDLKNSNKIVIDAESLPEPKTLEQLQVNYLLYEEKGLGVYFE